MEYIRVFVDVLSFFWFQTRSNRFIAPALSPTRDIRRIYRDLEFILLLDWMLRDT